MARSPGDSLQESHPSRVVAILISQSQNTAPILAHISIDSRCCPPFMNRTCDHERYPLALKSLNA